MNDKEITLKIQEILNDNPKVISFPSGIPLQNNLINLKSIEKIKGKKRKVTLQGK